MRFSFVTLFPQLIEGYFGASILHRAIKKSYLTIDFFNPRDFTRDKHRRVDAPMVGGGAGMLMTPQPLFDTLHAIKAQSPDAHTILLSPVGKPFVQSDAKRLANQSHIILLSGRYEGIDERVVEREVDEIFSIGDFILTGGELASMVVCDAVVRHVDGVLGNHESLAIESFEEGILEAPAFTKPTTYESSGVISEFLKGNHSKITDLKRGLALCKTKYFRPNLYKIRKGRDDEK
jgi:tRNA (guanine37-N1)-methyltransferase